MKYRPTNSNFITPIKLLIKLPEKAYNYSFYDKKMENITKKVLGYFYNQLRSQYRL